MTDTIRYEVADRIATITLNRPERMNAFTWEMVDAWAAALTEAQSDDKVFVVIVTGAGKAFCSGGDIQGMGERGERTPLQRKTELAGHVHRIPLALESVDKPVIAAINGAAAGAGLDLALQCDLRYAAASARLGETYVRVGLVPGAGGTWFLPRLVGTAKALELFWTGDLISAEEAERIGMINKVLPDEQLMDHVRTVADKIANALHQARGLSGAAHRSPHQPRSHLVTLRRRFRLGRPQGSGARLSREAQAELHRKLTPAPRRERGGRLLQPEHAATAVSRRPVLGYRRSAPQAAPRPGGEADGAGGLLGARRRASRRLRGRRDRSING
jgi:enoyl-CoA hydratase/carnithine racemase